MRPALVALLACLPAAALGHGAAPRVVEILFPPQDPDRVWAITDQQGLFGDQEGARRWLCEDAAAPLARFNGLAPVDDALRRWVVTADAGLFTTDDAGCNFQRLDDLEKPIGLWQDRGDPRRLWTATAREDAPNDVWRSADGGETWTPSGLALDGPITSLSRSADHLRLTHSGGALRSDDGGETFAALPLPPVEPSAFRLLAMNFGTSDEVDQARLWRLEDDTWTEVLRLDGPINALVVVGERGLLGTLFDGVWRSEDGGATWQQSAADIARMGCLTRAPDGALWACSDIFQGGPWATARSEDFGRTWQPRMANFVDVESGWLCGEDSDAWAACNRYCAEVVTGGICGAPAPDAGPVDADPPGVGIDAGRDGGVPDVSADARPAPDSGAPGAGGDGCNASGALPPTSLLLLLLFARKRRKSDK